MTGAHTEHISAAGRPLAYIIRATVAPVVTTFFTPPEFKQQVGCVVYPAGSEVPRHVHAPLERHLVGTSEVISVPGTWACAFRETP